MARGRPRIQPGQWGEVTVKQIGPKKYRATVTAVTQLNVQRVHRAVRENKGSATQAVLDMARATCNDGTEADGALNPDSSVAEFLQRYVEHRQDWSDSSRKTYQSAINKHINPTLGKMPLRAVTTPRIDSWLQTLTPGSAKTCRALLSGAFSQGVRWGLASVNPIRETSRPKQKRKEIITLDREQIEEWFGRVRAYQNAEKPGPARRAEFLGRMVAVMVGTGARPSEMLRMQWEDLDVSVDPPTLFLRGTKTESAARTVVVPNTVVEALEKQQAALGAIADLHPWVWPTSTGTHVSMSSLERWFRDVRNHWKEAHPGVEDPLPHVTPYIFRKTVATLIADELGEYAASRQLGHSDTAVTRRHYISQNLVGPDVSEILGSAGKMQE